MEKRGESHIEFILAFVLFITFTSIAISIYSPSRTSISQDSAVSYLISEVERNLTTEVEIYSVKINDPDRAIGGVIGMHVFVPQEYNLRIENYSGHVFASTKSGNEVYFVPEKNNFFYLIYSKDMDKNDAGIAPVAIDESNYVVSSVRVVNLISEKNMEEMRAAYFVDYANLKEELKLNNNQDFSLVFSIDDATIIEMDQQPAYKTEVYSVNKRKEIIRKDGVRVFADLNFKIW